MRIVSFQESFNDFTDHMCIIVFTQHCSLDCINCHNKYRLLKEPVIDTEQFFKYLQESKPLVKAVTISGGEPTCESDLIDFLKVLRMQGYLTRIDTNGTNARVLFRALPFLDEVAMDVKEDPNDFNKYKRICRTLTEKEFSNVQQSLGLLSDWVTNERKVILRTTMLDDLIDTEVIKKSLAAYKYTTYQIQHQLSKVK